MQYCMQYWIQKFHLSTNFVLDLFEQTFFGTNVFDQKEQQQKQQPQF